MTCPFAKFASILPLMPPTDAGDAKTASFHSIHGFARPSPSAKVALTLSEALRVGTAKSHRAVEKSRGVSLLLQSVSSSSSAVVEELQFDRVDYVRFNVMLACVYVALEAALYDGRSSALLKPLFADKDLLPELARSAALMEDVNAHLDTLQLHTGATLADLAENARELHTTTALSSTLAPEDIEDPSARTTLLQMVHASLPSALTLAGSPHPTAPSLTLKEEHIALLHPAQIAATLSYVSALLSLSPSRGGASGMLLSHAYTRYLGDLSGGQHIVRKVSKRFPCDPSLSPSDGFQFYAFPQGAQLKERFRAALEAAAPAGDGVDALVREANRAFDLNTALFESLLPAELRMDPAEVEKVSAAPVKLATHSTVFDPVRLTVLLALLTLGWLARSALYPTALA